MEDYDAKIIDMKVQYMVYDISIYKKDGESP